MRSSVQSGNEKKNQDRETDQRKDGVDASVHDGCVRVSFWGHVGESREAKLGSRDVIRAAGIRPVVDQTVNTISTTFQKNLFTRKNDAWGTPAVIIGYPS
jgi:hypothetical protein